ncbi:MAG TPA: 3-phosphoshikimate 1-carboxyvinyltransferase [Clostridiales bacterium]|nr:3-phosphoshikimate 1-carboxyvinyltransferase [Clostridiales bacterium]
MIIRKIDCLKGEIKVPGDKSISHRAIMLGSLAKGKTIISNFLQADDCLATIKCFKQMGITINNDKVNNIVTVLGNGLHGLNKPSDLLNVGNSGTTIRLMSGILSGQKFTSMITGDDSIQSRPMNRVIKPLLQMNADIKSKNNNGCAPLLINGAPNTMDNRSLEGIKYISPVASAQIKSCVLFAGLYANKATSVLEPEISRNHTELMLQSFGGKVYSDSNTVTVEPNPKLIGQELEVPGDISSAAYFIAAAILLPNSEITIKSLGINPTRDGIIEVCRNMGADIGLDNIRYYGSEMVADITIKHSSIKAIEISGEIIPRLIDEIPIIAVLACFAEGQTVIKDAEELKVKESNRIDEMVNNLSKMGADIVSTDDGMIINGGLALKGTNINSKFDHRIAMSFTIAGLMADGDTIIEGYESVNISYPEFYNDILKLRN